ncbi:unnamed protein product, partial [Durusdinium trenchii]
MPSWVAEDNYELLSLLRGLVATGKLRKDEVLLMVPLKCMLRRPLPWSELQGFSKPRLSWRLSQDEEIIVFLAALRKYGINSEWFRYVLTLPEDDANSTLSWRSEEVAALRGTPAHAPARQLRRQVLRLCEELTIGCAELRWAASHYWSRALRMKPKGFHAMVPGVDLMNFDPDSRNYFRMAGKSIAYIAGQDYEERQEILDSYGGKNDTYLLTHYGFLHQ